MSTPLDPPPHDSTGSHTPAPAAGSSPGPPGPRRTTSPALIIAGVALGLLVLGALLVWLVSSLVAGIGATLDSRGEPAGPDRPVTTATGGPGGEPSPRAPATTPASRPAPATPEATAVAGATVLRAPEDGALLSGVGRRHPSRSCSQSWIFSRPSTTSGEAGSAKLNGIGRIACSLTARRLES